MHFDTNGERAAQASALSERLAAWDEVPLLVGGDLNSRDGLDDGALRALANRIPVAACGTGRTNRWPLRLDVLFPIGRLDFVFASSDVSGCETLPDPYGSDHLPLLLTYRL
jgi:endonuclease/exonuclease/phosphatase (EEP) superfamily protein YafD